jgi:dihydrofolate synthase / folylpolyglutamate synthase
MNYAQATHFLFTLEHGSIKLGLQRIEAAVAARGHPQRRYRTIHVAGTNGKGSTCALIAAILERAGERTGLFTSPHLLEFTERIRVGGRCVPRAELAHLTTELKPLILELELSFFEATTLLAFEVFARRGVTRAVIEVGMGGRLDATNVITPELTIVTGIDRDHVKALGRTLEAIAGEKAGIMKPGVPLLLAPCSRGVERVFLQRGRSLGSPVARLADLIACTQARPRRGGARYRWRRVDGSTGVQTLALHGEHQVGNALLASEAARRLRVRGRPIREEVIRAGIARCRWPGRFQMLPARRGQPPVIFDVGHNPQGAAAVAATWRRWMGTLPPPTLIVGMLGDKDHAGFFRALQPLAPGLCLIPLDSPRAGPLAPIESAARRAGLRPRRYRSMASAWREARRRGRPVLIMGSFLTVEAGMRLLGVPVARALFPQARRSGARRGAS